MQPYTALGMLLTFYTDSMGLKTICRMFGCPPATECRTINSAEQALLKTLYEEPLAKIAWPSIKQQEEWARLVEKKNPIIKNRWGFVDGKNFAV